MCRRVRNIVALCMCVLFSQALCNSWLNLSYFQRVYQFICFFLALAPLESSRFALESLGVVVVP